MGWGGEGLVGGVGGLVGGRGGGEREGLRCEEGGGGFFCFVFLPSTSQWCFYSPASKPLQYSFSISFLDLKQSMQTKTENNICTYNTRAHTQTHTHTHTHTHTLCLCLPLCVFVCLSLPVFLPPSIPPYRL